MRSALHSEIIHLAYPDGSDHSSSYSHNFPENYIQSDIRGIIMTVRPR